MRWNQKHSKDEVFNIVEDYKQSGLSQKAYANQSGINIHTFKSWVLKYNNHHNPKTEEPEEKKNFIPLEVRKDVVSDSVIKIAYPNGVQLSLPVHTSPDDLRVLINLQ